MKYDRIPASGNVDWLAWYGIAKPKPERDAHGAWHVFYDKTIEHSRKYAIRRFNYIQANYELSLTYNGRVRRFSSQRSAESALAIMHSS